MVLIDLVWFEGYGAHLSTFAAKDLHKELLSEDVGGAIADNDTAKDLLKTLESYLVGLYNIVVTGIDTR